MKTVSMMERREIILKRVLLLLLDNNNLSASREGLNKRAENRKEAIRNMLNLLNINTEDAEGLYWTWREKKDD